MHLRYLRSFDSGKGIGYASQAIDGIVTDASRWSAMVTTAKPENTVTFDFGEIRCVSSVDIAFYASSARKYDFDIKVSNDGQKWKKVNTYASDGKTQELKFERFEFEKVNAVAEPIHTTASMSLRRSDMIKRIKTHPMLLRLLTLISQLCVMMTTPRMTA